MLAALKGLCNNFFTLRKYRLERIPDVNDLWNTRSFFTPRNRSPRKKLKKNEQRSPPQLAARTSGHVIWSRLYAANVDHSHALGLAKHRTRAEFQTLLWLGYCRRCSDWTRATTRMLLELSIITSLNRVPTQCSGPIYEPHSNIVIRVYCDPRVTSSNFARERLNENDRFCPWNYTATKEFLGQWHCMRVSLSPTSASKLV